MSKITEEIRKQKASSFYTGVQDLVVALACRWLDECKYEDIKEYQDRLQKEADKFGVKITSMKKRPFGCLFVVVGAEEVVYQLSCAGKSYSYKRIN